jgi:hypothetical protein
VPGATQLYSNGNASVLDAETGSKPVAWLRFSDKYGNVVRVLPAGTSLVVTMAVVKNGVATNQKVNAEFSTAQLSDSFSADEMGFRCAAEGPACLKS